MNELTTILVLTLLISRVKTPEAKPNSVALARRITPSISLYIKMSEQT